MLTKSKQRNRKLTKAVIYSPPSRARKRRLAVPEEDRAAKSQPGTMSSSSASLPHDSFTRFPCHSLRVTRAHRPTGCLQPDPRYTLKAVAPAAPGWRLLALAERPHMTGSDTPVVPAKVDGSSFIRRAAK